MRKISVIIPIYNALSDTKNLLKSLLNNFNFDLGIITLINDNSNQTTTKYLRKFQKNILNLH